MRRRSSVLLAVLLTARAGAAGLPGELDPTFNGGQPLIRDLSRTVPRSSFFNGVALDPAGGFVLVGTATDESGRGGVGLLRVNDDGTEDASFASGGAQVLQLGLGTTPFSVCYGVEPRPSGGWIVGGFASGVDDRNAGLVAALEANGMLDLAFGSGGSIRPQVATTPSGSWLANGIAVAPDGSALLTGMLETDPMTGANRKLVVAKVTAEGNIAVGFGNQPALGALVQGFSQVTDTGSQGSDLLVTQSGVLVAGLTYDTLSRHQFLLVRLLAGGGLDPSFAGGVGFVRAQVADPAAPTRDSQGTDVAVGPDAEIYVAGQAVDSDERLALAVTRFTPGGVLDTTFAVNGTRRLQLGSGNDARTNPAEVLVQPDGKVVVVGNVSSAVGGADRKIVVLRLDTRGDLDPSFGQGGLAFVQHGSRSAAGGAALSADARAVLIGGSTTGDGEVHTLTARVLLEPLPTTTTSTTLPGGCAAGPSLAGARCRVALLAGALQGAAPSAKLAGRLGRTLDGAANRLASAEGSSGRTLRKRLRKARARLQLLRTQLDGQAAVRGIAADQRAALAAETDALVAETAALLAAA
jgi:uncharacterized delta-60 repeat protein